MEESYDSKIAAFNSAFGVTIRITSILNACLESSQYMDGYTWFHNLQSFRREISSKMNDKQKEETKKILSDLEPNVNKFVITNRMTPELYKQLDEAEIELRKIADEKDLLIPDKKTVLDMMREL